ncbi:G5 and 3D domain-containing protein [Virgibacillus dakarensis]|uniref:G5 and 3D domain-containing protein n=1 Tax=Virgibacillus dakarensis TaxID=1917889 RepID=UPI000B449357|nr:G5 and 3D domain-containing protein [Virgibacillus dakarensis]
MKVISKLLPALKWKLVISGIGVLALAVFSSLLLIEAQKAEVALTEDGKKQTVKTHANTVEELLNEEGIAIGEHDDLSPGPATAIEDGMMINVKHAKQVVVKIDGAEREYFTTEETIGEFLKANDLSFTKHDDTSFAPDDAIKDGLELKIKKAFQIAVNDGGDKQQYWTTGGTIEEFLAAKDITYEADSDDKIEPALDEQVTRDTAITITRIEKLPNIVLEEPVPIETETKKDDTLEKGEEKVIKEGKQGKLEKTYEAYKKNGEEKRGDLINTEITVESVNRIVAIGAKEPESETASEPNVVKTVSSNNDSNAEVLYMTATAFTADCSGCSGHTATGIDLKANPNAKVIAVDPNVIPLGSKVWVEGYGNAIAADTGGFSGNHIDLHVPTKADAYSFGRKKVKVKVMN